MIYGLFKVTERVYQVRGFDLANITYIKGDRGWIVMDPLLTIESAKAAHALVKQHLGDRPIVAVIYSHSHPDHYGGVRGLVDEADVRSGRVRIIAPEGFMAHAVSEMVLAGSAMARRAAYMYGMFLPRDAQGNVGSGLGIANATGTVSLIAPTQSITKTGQELVIDGVKMVFQLTPDTEAPAEMNTYFPQFKAMWMAENATHTLHNIQTLRGPRSATRWRGPSTCSRRSSCTATGPRSSSRPTTGRCGARRTCATTSRSSATSTSTSTINRCTC
nr:MBL fold metallo-hydrolase [Nannocystis pusilla]